MRARSSLFCSAITLCFASWIGFPSLAAEPENGAGGMHHASSPSGGQTPNGIAPGAASTIDVVRGLRLVEGRPNSVFVPEEARTSLGMRKGDADQIAVAEQPTHKRRLTLRGQTALDPARLFRIRARFAPAEVMEIGKIDDSHASPGSVPPVRRDLQAGDRVRRGDLLAVLLSVELGKKKSDLFDALSLLRFDEDVLRQAEARPAAAPEFFLFTAKRNVLIDLNAVSRAENALKTWGIPEQEIQAIRDEAKDLGGGRDRRARDKERLREWTRMELRAPADGFLIEQNLALRDTVVDNATNLMQIANVDSLLVLVALPETDLPALQDLCNLTQNRIGWTVKMIGTGPMVGLVDSIGYRIDAKQHTAVVRGHIPNPSGMLRAGQSVAATIELLPARNVVEVPIGALVEDGQESIVFVQTDPQEPIYTMRRVVVTDRFDGLACVRSVSEKDDERAAGEEGQRLQPPEPLRAGERVLASGVRELKTALRKATKE